MKILIITLLLLSFLAFGDVYKREAAGGRVYYTDKPVKNLKYQRIRKKGEKEIAGSRYFCESLFWASQPKQAAKT